MKIRFFKPFFSEYPPKLPRVMAVLGVSVPESKKRKPQQRHGLLKFKNLPCRAGTCPTAVVRTLNVGRDDSARRCRNYRVRTNSLPMSLRGVTRRGNLVQDPPILYPLTHPVCLSRKLKPRPAKHPALFPHGCDQLRKQPHLLRRQPLCVQKLRRLICLSSQQIIRTAPVKIRQREQILRAGCTLSRLIARNDRRGNTQSIRNLPLRIAAADPQIPQALR